MTLKVSVVIPTRNSERTIETCLVSVFKNKDLFEVIIVDSSDDRTAETVSKYPVKLVRAPQKNISEARNLGISQATGDIVAFTDDDCEVTLNWISRALSYFEDSQVGAVGGPNLTHPNSKFLERCAGMALSSRFGTGLSVHRYSAVDDGTKSMNVDESKLVTCNLFLRKTILDKIGLFNENQFPCEENELLHRMKKNGSKLLYVPALLVWHRRRPIILPFAKQIYLYGTGRALLLRRYISSFKPVHIIPSIFVIGILLGSILSLLSSAFRLVYAFAIILYLLMATVISVRVVTKGKEKPFAIFLIIVTFWTIHIAYGIGFMHGLFKKTCG